MEIYVEYALAENFFLDAMLLWLALRTAKQNISPGRLVLASAVGAAFAVVFPLLRLGTVFSYILRFAVGFLLCLIAVKGKGGGRYAITSLLFFGYSFGLGGARRGTAISSSARPWGWCSAADSASRLRSSFSSGGCTGNGRCTALSGPAG